MKTFADRLAYLRKDALGLSQAAFAKRIEVSRGAVANWEVGGDISLDNLARISREFEVSMDWLEKAKGQPPKASENVLPPKPALDLAQERGAILAPTSRAQPNAANEKLSPGRWRQIPIYGQAVAGVDGEFLMNGEGYVLFASALKRRLFQCLWREGFWREYDTPLFRRRACLCRSGPRAA